MWPRAELKSPGGPTIPLVRFSITSTRRLSTISESPLCMASLRAFEARLHIRTRGRCRFQGQFSRNVKAWLEAGVVQPLRPGPAREHFAEKAKSSFLCISSCHSRAGSSLPQAEDARFRQPIDPAYMAWRGGRRRPLSLLPIRQIPSRAGSEAQGVGA